MKLVKSMLSSTGQGTKALPDKGFLWDHMVDTGGQLGMGASSWPAVPHLTHKMQFLLFSQS